MATQMRCALPLVVVLLLPHADCQGENNFFYNPVERSFAQVQPQLYNTRQQYYEQRPEFTSQRSFAGPAPDLPNPNYNQNPSPFQLPTGRSQPSGQYYLNQADYSPVQKSRFRQPSQSLQFQPASTYRPDTSQIHSLAYQHDPSRPEMFLGQITLDNPDTDFFPVNRFKQFDENSLRSSNSFKPSAVEEDEGGASDDDLFRDRRVTTYNPNRVKSPPQKLTRLGAPSLQPSADTSFNFDGLFHHNIKAKYPTPAPQNIKSFDYKVTTFRVPAREVYNLQNRVNLNTQLTSTTEHKGLHELEPFLEDDIADMTYRDLLKDNQNGSNDVEVIKSVMNKQEDTSYTEKYDSHPSPSSMNAGNISKEISPQTTASTKTSIGQNDVSDHRVHGPADYESDDKSIEYDKNASKLQTKNPTNIQTNDTNDKQEAKNGSTNDSNTEEIEYEYYYGSDEEQTTEKTEDSQGEDEEGDDNEDYITEYEDTASEPESENNTPDNKNNHNDSDKILENNHKEKEITTTRNFVVVTLKPNNTMVKDDNFKEFVDTTSMDNVEAVESTESYSDNPDYTSVETPAILRQEVVSVVTTKSVVNGTISIPDAPTSPRSTKKVTQKPPTNTTPPTTTTKPASSTLSSTTFASVQTSRSISGARFLPFPAVGREDKKQVINSDSEETGTKNSQEPTDRVANDASSTESISDKLEEISDRLSSSVLTGNYKNNAKNINIIKEASTEVEPTTTSAASIKLFTVKTTTTSSTTEKSAPGPLPVMIKKFDQNSRPSTTTTEKPRRKPSFVTAKVDDLTGLLPAGYKPRPSYKDRKKSSTTSEASSTTARTTEPLPSAIDESINSTQGRSSGITNKNKVILQKDTPLTLPKDVKPKEQPSLLEDLFSKFKSEDVSMFLPPGFQANETTTTAKPKTFKFTTVADKIDISAFLPKGFKLDQSDGDESIVKTAGVNISALLPKYYKGSTTASPPKSSKFTTVADKVDISAFLPKGFKLDKSNSDEKDIVKKVQITDLTSLLPTGYNASKATGGERLSEDEKEESSSENSSSESRPSNGFKIVFPSRTGSKPTRKTITSKPVGGIGPATLIPTIHKGWPTRASTEFTGWPSPSTTPFSIDKLLEAQRNATATSPGSVSSTEATIRRTTTTTSTTAAPPPPTTPGVCRHDCDIAATIKIVKGVEWVPELLDHHTEEWKKLAQEVKDELNSVYSKSELLKKWYKGIRIDAFSKGSVLVDYFVELHAVGDRVDTLELKSMFHKTLNQARPGSVVEVVEETPPEKQFDPDRMQGDQPDEERLKVTKSVDKSAGKLEIGKFVVDPAFTEFIVLPKRHEPVVGKAEEDAFLPQWGIAVIVIALASLLFVVIFGVTVLVNRQKSAKAKQPIPLSEDMLRELDKSHMGGYDDLHLKERELPYPPSKQRRLSTTFVEQMSYPGAAGDSWRSEWTPQLQQYMQHYTPDSGRGSQLYGTGGNPYGYGGSQLYGQTGGGGGSLYGYQGEHPPHPRSHYSRRRSEYDAGF